MRDHDHDPAHPAERNNLTPEEVEAKARQTAHLAAIVHATAILPEAISEEFARYPNDLATWNARYAAAYRDRLLAKANLSETRMSVERATRERFKQIGEKITEAAITMLVETDDRVKAAVRADIEADSDRVRLFGELDALRSKGDMLQSLGGFLRAEFNSYGGAQNGRRSSG